MAQAAVADGQGRLGHVAAAFAQQMRGAFHPHLPHGWSELGGLGGGEEGQSAAEMALRVALKAVPPRGELTAGDLARAYAGTGRAVDAQKAVMVAPWEKAGWQALGAAVKG